MEIGTATGAVRHYPASHLRHQTTQERIIIAQHDCAVKGDAVHEFEESAFHVPHIAVAIHVLTVDVGHHRKDGRELQE